MGRAKYDAIVIGGGFYGCSLAIWLKNYFPKILLIEAKEDLLQRASYTNQARVHNGFHYPRSILTSLRSRVNFPKFVADFTPSIRSDFEKYYAVARDHSKVSAAQFKNFMNRIAAPIIPPRHQVMELFDMRKIEAVFQVKEYVFDAVELKKILVALLDNTRVEVHTQELATRIAKGNESGLILSTEGFNQGVGEYQTRFIINCTYSNINNILQTSDLALIPLKHEITEMSLIEVPDPLKNKGFTIMCGPFFSVLPFPPRGLHTLSHVRYTPHVSWSDPGGFHESPDKVFEKMQKKTYSHHMIKDAERYIPSLSAAKYIESLWEIKTVLPESEQDDSRPILFKIDKIFPNLISILGGKIDNIYDVQVELYNYLRL